MSAKSHNLHKVDKDYIIEHLKQYVVFQMKQGYELKSVKDALLSYGYSNDLIHSVTHIVKKIGITTKKVPPKYREGDLDKDLYIYVQSMLVDYIVKEAKLGYSLSAIRTALINFGHHSEMVDKAIKLIKKGNVHDLRGSFLSDLPRQIVFALCFLAVFVFIVFVSMSTNESIGIVLVSFSPILITLLLVNIFMGLIDNKLFSSLLPLIALLVATGLFLALVEVTTIIRGTDVDVLLILNVIGTFITSSLVCLLSKPGKDKEAVIIKSTIVDGGKNKDENKKHKEKDNSKDKSHSISQKPLGHSKPKAGKIKLKEF